MSEEQRLHTNTIALGQDIRAFPSYEIDLSGKRDRRIRGIEAMLSGLYSVASVAHTSGKLLQSEIATVAAAREVAYDISHVHRMSSLMEAISHFGRIVHSPRKISSDIEKIEWERSMRYIIDLPEDQFFGKQRHGLGVAKHFAAKLSRQPQHRGAYINVMSKHIHALRTELLSPFSKRRLGFSPTPLDEEQRTIHLQHSNALSQRERILYIIDHDMRNGLNALGMRQHVRAHILAKLAKLSEDVGDSLGSVAELQKLRVRLREDEESILSGWNHLLDSSIYSARLMEEPYPKIKDSSANWQEKVEEAALTLDEAHPDLEIWLKIKPAFGTVTWSPEWVQSLVENAGQNAKRIWQDAKVLKLPHTQIAKAHPMLGISTKTDAKYFSITLQDNGTGFSREYLERGFQGQHGYVSHNHSTGIAMKELVEMVKAYGGEMVLRNVYDLPDGSHVESSDPEFSQKSSAIVVGGVVEVRLPLT